MPKPAKRTGWNKQMHDLRAETGLGVAVVVHRAWNLLPEGFSQKGTKMLERYEKDYPEEKADPIFLTALATVYEKPLSALSALAAERMAAVTVLGGPGAGRDSRCYSNSAGEALGVEAA